MGNFLTKLKDFNTMLDEEFPSTPPMTKKVLDKEFDPRSPSTEITRTPIQVERTPELLSDPRSPTVGIMRTPIHAEMEEVDDPRSPTVGVMRTPIHADMEEVDDPRSPTCGIDRTPIYIKTKNDLTASPPPPLLISLAETEEIPSDKTEQEVPNSESDESECKSTKSSDNNVSVTPPTPSDQSAVRKRKPKQLFQGLENTPPTAKPMDVQKSPLKVVDQTSRSPFKVIDNSPRSQLVVKKKLDVNSPRAIVQRKQATKLNTQLGGCGHNQLSPARSPAKFRIYHDEENM